MGKYVYKEVGGFLELNGFVQCKTSSWSNDKCLVDIFDDYYRIVDLDDGAETYSKDHNIYWLIGQLTYCGFMDKNYKQK